MSGKEKIYSETEIIESACSHAPGVRMLVVEATGDRVEGEVVVSHSTHAVLAIRVCVVSRYSKESHLHESGYGMTGKQLLRQGWRFAGRDTKEEVLILCPYGNFLEIPDLVFDNVGQAHAMAVCPWDPASDEEMLKGLVEKLKGEAVGLLAEYERKCLAGG